MRNWVQGEATFIKRMNGSRSIDAICSAEEPLFVRTQPLKQEEEYVCKEERPRVLLWSGLKKFRATLQPEERCCLRGRCARCVDGVPWRVLHARMDELSFFGHPWRFELSDHAWVMAQYKGFGLLTFKGLEASPYLKTMFLDEGWLLSRERFEKQADVIQALDPDVITLQEVGVTARAVYERRFPNHHQVYAGHQGSRGDGLMVLSKLRVEDYELLDI